MPRAFSRKLCTCAFSAAVLSAGSSARTPSTFPSAESAIDSRIVTPVCAAHCAASRCSNSDSASARRRSSRDLMLAAGICGREKVAVSCSCGRAFQNTTRIYSPATVFMQRRAQPRSVICASNSAQMQAMQNTAAARFNACSQPPPTRNNRTVPNTASPQNSTVAAAMHRTASARQSSNA